MLGSGDGIGAFLRTTPKQHGALEPVRSDTKAAALERLFHFVGGQSDADNVCGVILELSRTLGTEILG